jgi:hypothetical protein
MISKFLTATHQTSVLEKVSPVPTFRKNMKLRRKKQLQTVGSKKERVPKSLICFSWIRIRIGNPDPDPVRGAKKWTKINK